MPVVYVAGTCMNAGKTVAATELVRGLTRGWAPSCGGQAHRRLAHARRAVDAGRGRRRRAHLQRRRRSPSTHAGVTVATAKGIFNRLAQATPDVIVAELGDGILGEYGVQDILRDAELTGVGAAYVMAAPDPVACWGAAELMRREYGLPITAVTGPATDNEVGNDYIAGGARACRRTTRGATPTAWSPRCGPRWSNGRQPAATGGTSREARRRRPFPLARAGSQPFLPP